MPEGTADQEAAVMANPNAAGPAEDDPLTYFLTPVFQFDDETDSDLDFDFDAGIQSTKHPRDTVRSVSPSSLDREIGLWSPDRAAGSLLRPPPRDGPPPLLWGGSASSDEDEDEDYFRFHQDHHRLQGYRPPWEVSFLPRESPKSRIARFRPAAQSPDRLPPPAPSMTGPGQLRGPSSPDRRPPLVRGGRGGRSSPAHSWREPSPDVWSIQELPDEEMDEAELCSGRTESGAFGQPGVHEEVKNDLFERSVAIDIPAAKPRKRVRFQLPVTEWL